MNFLHFPAKENAVLLPQSRIRSTAPSKREPYGGAVNFAATEKAEKFYTQVNMKDGCMFIMGSEDTGIDEELLALADEQIKIPQFGKIESLNVSAAAAILMYEAVRQRS